MSQYHITDDLDALLDVLPSNVRHAVEKLNDSAGSLNQGHSCCCLKEDRHNSVQGI